MDLTTAYLTGTVALIGLFALRCPDENLRVVFALGAVWPLSILAILAMIVIQGLGWDFDVAEGRKMFGFRRPTNPKARGYALTLFKCEFQLYKLVAQ